MTYINSGNLPKRSSLKNLLEAFYDTLNIQLSGPFEVLAGEFDRPNAPQSLLLHWRWRFDPAEFFTVMVGGTDGLHWGYCYDDPAQLPSCVVANYARADAYNWVCGMNLI